jgi:class 3 adenylate cyclase/tetratricopeptide (TPR) repeat protein
MPADRLVGERRQLTVLFCDIVGSTELAARHDPEEWQTICAQYQRCGAGTVERFGGYVAQFLGDGLLVYFGYPLIHDDGPERGVRAGLAILDAMVGLNAQLERQHGVRLGVRVGVHTGEVVIGEGGGKETEVFGEAIHVAARVQQLAGRDEVLITDSTYRLVPGLFLMEARGAHPLRGIPEPVALYRVLQPSGVRGRLQAAATRGLTPFVGREAERALLRSRFERAEEGQGQVVLICGEPGIGKSRLLQVFREDLAGRAETWIECGTSPYHENTPFFCVIDMLQQALALQCGDSTEQRLVVLERALATAGLNVQESLPLVASLIGLDVAPERYPPLAGSPGQQRQRTMATLVRWLVGAAGLQPVVLVVEDLMWADPSTLELLELLGQQAARTRVLLLYTARPEFRHAWPPRSNFTTVTLDRLSQPQVRQMVASALPELVETLVARSDGVPLFAEELMCLVKDTVGRSAESDIPATLQDLLTARLDRLGTARRIAQIGAVIGREFSYELLAAVGGAAGPELDAALARLTEAELLHARGIPPDATYVFKHALIRDAAYGSLLKSRRRELHTAIASALAERFPDTAEALPELVAHHYTEAGEREAAWRAWQRAGELAVARSALLEAAGHFTTACEVLDTLPDTPERAQQALGLQILLGQALAATKGYGAREVTDAFARARALARQLGGTPELLSILFGLWTSVAGQGELGVARDLADELLGVAERAGMRAERVWGHLAHGINHYSLGDATPARKHLAGVVALYREVEWPPSPSDPGVMALSYAMVNSWMLGLIDEARTLSREANELAERLRNPFAVAWAGFFTAALHVFLGEPRDALEHTEPLLALCREHQFPLFVGLTTIVRGAAISGDGRREEGLAELRNGLRLYAATGQRVSHRLYLAWLAQACVDAGAIEEATATVAEALAMHTEERLFESELLRLRAELLARQGAEATGVEASFLAALALARRQAARSLELRAATSYAHWLEGARRSAEARERLAEVCGWFPDGLDTGDLRAARVVLRGLSA